MSYYLILPILFSKRMVNISTTYTYVPVKVGQYNCGENIDKIQCWLHLLNTVIIIYCLLKCKRLQIHI